MGATGAPRGGQGPRGRGGTGRAIARLEARVARHEAELRRLRARYGRMALELRRGEGAAAERDLDGMLALAPGGDGGPETLDGMLAGSFNPGQNSQELVRFVRDH